MKTRINVATILVLALAFVLPSTAGAADLSAAQVQALKDAGIPVYPGSKFVSDDNGDAIVMIFDTEDSIDKIMDWYVDQLPGWSATVVNDWRVVYKGPKGLEVKQFSTMPYIFAVKTNNYPGDTTREITVRIPK